MMRRLIIVAIGLLFGLMIISAVEQVSAQGSKKTPTPVRTHTPEAATPAPTSDSWNYNNIAQSITDDGTSILGSPKARFIVMAFIDFSCPHCLEYRTTIHQIVDKIVRTRKARLMFRLQTFVGGKASVSAAQAALCAGDQGHFWEMQDALFDVARDMGIAGFTTEQLKTLATALKLDRAAFDTCLQDGSTDTALQNSLDMGNQYGLEGVPALMISSDGGQTFEWFKDNHGDDLKGGGLSLDVVETAIDQLQKTK